MNEQDRLEQQIREVLATETHAIPLSNKLFHPDGLFSRLARTEEERRAVSQTPLFHQAQKRLSELQRKEAEEFGRVAKQAQTTFPEGSLWLQLEQVKNA